MKNFPGFLSAIIVLVFFSACGSSRSTTAAPAEAAPRTLAPLPASEINIPVKINIRPLLAVLDTMTAKEFTNDQWPAYTQSGCDFRYKYRFVRSPFTLSCINNKIDIGFRGNYQIAGSRCICAFDKQISPWASGTCGFGSEPMRRVDINITSNLTLMPNHQVLTTTRLNRLQALDKCEVTIMKNDMTKDVMDSIKASVETYTAVFDQFVQDINNNPLLQEWRKNGSRVMPVSSYGFLNLNPTQLRVGPLNIKKDTLYFTLGYNGFPHFSSDSNRLVNDAPLPPLNGSARSGGVVTYLDAVYEYDFFNKILNDSLRNKPFEVEGRTFVIKDVQISGDNSGKIRLDVAFTGNRKGVLHISGTPLLDTAAQVLSMPDISFALDTRDMLVNIAKNMFRKKIMKKLQDQSVLDFAALIRENMKAIEDRMNQQVTEWMQTTGSLRELKLVGLLPQKDHIQVQAKISADIVLIGSPTANLLGMSY